MEKLSIDQDMRADQKAAAITYDAVFIQVMAKNFKPGDDVKWKVIVQQVDIYIQVSQTSQRTSRTGIGNATY